MENMSIVLSTLIVLMLLLILIALVCAIVSVAVSYNKYLKDRQYYDNSYKSYLIAIYNILYPTHIANQNDDLALEKYKTAVRESLLYIDEALDKD